MRRKLTKNRSIKIIELIVLQTNSIHDLMIHLNPNSSGISMYLSMNHQLDTYCLQCVNQESEISIITPEGKLIS